MIKEEIKMQRDKLKNKSFKDKLKYFWYYYKFWLLGGIVITVCAVLFITGWIESSKEPSIYLALVNCNYMTDADTPLIDDFVSSRNIDINEHPARFDISINMDENSADNSSLASSQRMMAMLQTSSFDIIVADEWVIKDYAEVAAFCNLEETLPAELFEKVKDRLYYFTYEDDGTIPIGFYGDDIKKLMFNNGYLKENPPIVTISNTTKRLDTSIDFIRYLFEE